MSDVGVGRREDRQDAGAGGAEWRRLSKIRCRDEALQACSDAAGLTEDREG
jgi:hypothetical protein